jgi:hypothetical protein
MRIILEGGYYDGDWTDIDEHVGQLAPYGHIYKIAAGEFIEGRQVFRFDEKATLAQKYGKPNSLKGNADWIGSLPSAHG